MEGPGFATFKLVAVLLALGAAYGATIKSENDRGPTFIVMDRHKDVCGGMAGFFGCER